MHARRLHKPDGRELVLYGREPLPELVAPAPPGGTGGSHLRWHPLRGEWIVYAGHRQHRTFLPPAEFDPLAPTIDPAQPTEVPAGPWDVAVFENLFSALSGSSGGRCEVVVFTQQATGSLGALPLWHLEMIVDVWVDRTQALAGREDVAYVFPFENRGVEVGVTLHHPHGQIYAYPFVPPIAARELELQAQEPGLVAKLVAAELADGRRVLHAGDHVAAFVPPFARWAYEVWIAPRRAVPLLGDLTVDERRDLARALKTVLMKLDGLWAKPMPYLLAVHQAPVKGRHPHAHVHLEIYPWLRMPGRLKYLAGSEIGAGVFTADTLPEDKAAELRAIEVHLE